METVNTYYTGFPDLREFVVWNKELLLAKDNKAVLVQIFSGIIDKNKMEWSPGLEATSLQFC